MLGVVDPLENNMIIFDIDKSDHPHLPPSISLQIPVSIKNIIVQQCIVYEGASTCVMFAKV